MLANSEKHQRMMSWRIFDITFSEDSTTVPTAHRQSGVLCKGSFKMPEQFCPIFPQLICNVGVFIITFCPCRTLHSTLRALILGSQPSFFPHIAKQEMGVGVRSNIIYWMMRAQGPMLCSCRANTGQPHTSISYLHTVANGGHYVLIQDSWLAMCVTLNIWIVLLTSTGLCTCINVLEWGI